MKATAMQELIEKFKEAKRYISVKSEYADGYDGALSDCISVSESYLEKEKKQIIDFAVWFNNGDNSYKSYEEIVNQYYNE